MPSLSSILLSLKSSEKAVGFTRRKCHCCTVGDVLLGSSLLGSSDLQLHRTAGNFSALTVVITVYGVMRAGPKGGDF